MLGLTRVGLIIGHPARDYAFSVNELLLASRLHAQAVQADGENGGRFVVMKARPVLQTNPDPNPNPNPKPKPNPNSNPNSNPNPNPSPTPYP